MVKTMIDGVSYPEAEKDNFDNLMQKEQKVTGRCSEPQCGYTPDGTVACIPKDIESNSTRDIIGSVKDRKQKFNNNSKRGYIKR